MNNKSTSIVFLLVFVCLLFVYYWFYLQNQKKVLEDLKKDDSSNNPNLTLSWRREEDMGNKFWRWDFDAIKMGNDYDASYKNYKSQYSIIEKYIKSGSGKEIYDYQWIDTFIPMMYICELFQKWLSSSSPEVELRRLMADNKSILLAYDSQGNQTGDFKLMNDALNSFHSGNISFIEYLQKVSKLLENHAGKSKFYNYLYNLILAVSDAYEKKSSIECSTFVKWYF